jgi:ATP-dependent Zn protease
MRGHETARQIIERQRAAVKALAEELLEVESVDADRLRDVLAASVLPATTFPPAVRDALIEARLQS